MKLAILGAGNVGRALARGWAHHGHSITFGVRDAADPKHAAAVACVVDGRPGAAPPAVASAVDAVHDAEVIVLAVPWQEVPSLAKAIAAAAIGRIVLDATNPLTAGPAGLALAIGFTTSGGEEVARLLPGASVFKTMNQVGFAVMSDAAGYAAAPTMFVAGDDARTKPVVMSLVAKLGFDAVDAGPLRISRLLEPYAMLWIDQVVNHGAPTHSAFALLRDRTVGSPTAVVEYVRYQLRSHGAAEFEAACAEACHHLAAAPECRGYELSQCDEAPSSFVLRIDWVSAEAHLQGFRAGRHFPPFLAAIRPFVDAIVEMRHYRVRSASR